jgi:hypothetical protein
MISLASHQNRELALTTLSLMKVRLAQHGFSTFTSIPEGKSRLQQKPSVHLQSFLLLVGGQSGPALRSAAILLWLESMLSSEENTTWSATSLALYHRKLSQVPITPSPTPPAKASFGSSTSMSI